MAGKAAARVGDKVWQDVKMHCHNPSHPLVPPAVGPIPHLAKPLAIMDPGSKNVNIDGKAAAIWMGQTDKCMLPSCIAAGPGMLMGCSAKVMISKKFAVREGDVSLHMTCVAPVPSPNGKVIKPCSPKVKIG